MATGRILKTQISLSEQVNDMSLKSRLLFTWIIPHLDDFGRLEASARQLKFRIAPMAQDISIADVETALQEMKANQLIDLYTVSGIRYLAYTKFDDHQTGLHKRTKSKFPAPEDADNSCNIRELSGDSGNFLEITGISPGTEQNRTGTEQEYTPSESAKTRSLDDEKKTVVKSEKKPKKNTEVINQRMSELIAAYADAYKERYNANPVPPSAKERGIVKRLAENSMSADRMRDLVRHYLKMDNSWFVTKCHDWATFEQNLAVVSTNLQTGHNQASDNSDPLTQLLKQESAVYGKVISSETIEGYRKYLGDYALDQIKRAFELIHKDSDNRFFPRPAEIIDKIKMLAKRSANSNELYSTLSEDSRDAYIVLTNAINDINRFNADMHEVEIRNALHLQRHQLTMNDVKQHYDASKQKHKCACSFCTAHLNNCKNLKTNSEVKL